MKNLRCGLRTRRLLQRNELNNLLQEGGVPGLESVRVWREDFEQSNDAIVGEDGHGKNRTYAERAAGFGIDARIVFRVVGVNDLRGTHAFSGKSIGGVDGGAERGRDLAAAGVAEHLLVGTQGKRGAAGSGPLAGVTGDEIEGGGWIVGDGANLSA